MSKKRVYDLAKEYGMTGQILAAKLRDFGFTNVKSHMSALTEFEELEIRGRLEAYGFNAAKVEAEADPGESIGGLKIRRKKKKVVVVEEPPQEAPAEVAPSAPMPAAEADADTGADSGSSVGSNADAPREVSTEATEPAVEPRADKADVLVPAERASSEVKAPTEQPAPREVAETKAQGSATAPSVETPGSSKAQPVGTGPGPDSTVGAAKTAAPGSVDAGAAQGNTTQGHTKAPAQEDTASTEKSPSKTAASADQAAPAQKASAESQPAAPTKESAPAKESAPDKVAAGSKEEPAKGEAAKPAETGDKVIRPSEKRRAGKVVGFIDPSKFAQPAKRRVDSRRLRSRDDVVPKVMPTMGRDRGTGQVRGDQTRGSLTAQQLRDREQGRFLRRRRQNTGAGAGRRGGARRDPSLGSPFADTTVTIAEPISIKKLANKLSVKENAVFRIAMKELGYGITINSLIDNDTAVLLAAEFEVELDIVPDIAIEEALLKELSDRREAIVTEDLMVRSPTVAFLGHVDHGKTTLIDTIRKSRIANAEAGGITQHIGAYQVQTKAGHTVTVVDTPGHAAFTQMRARGASAVDIVVLVVAADDGVKPQTEEAINHAKAAGTLIIVALNKMDKPEANPERVRNELSALGLIPEEYGGETAMLPVSALKGDGVDDLLERVFLESEVLELHCHPTGPASGVVLEAEIQKGRGKVAHLLVQDGNLKQGDVILAGEGYGKVRSIHNDRGKMLKSAGPSMPVQVTGLNELPSVGDKFHVVDNLDKAKEVAEERGRKLRQIAQIEYSKGRGVSLENLFEAVAQSEKPTINLIIKADVKGSADVLKEELAKLTNDEVEVKIVHSGVGQVLESDVDLAITSKAHILAFHTSVATKVRQKSDREGIQVKIYQVIYELLDDVKRFMEGELAPELHEEITGHAEIRVVFRSSKFGNIAGSMVLDGTINRNNKARLIRDGDIVYTGSLSGLRRENDAAKDVREGFECGILLQNYNDIKEGDIVETFKIVEVKRTL